MIALLSPAKTLDFESSRSIGDATQPLFLEKSSQIMEALKKKNVKKLRQLQGISQKLAEENYQRNQNWTARPQKGYRQAVLAFKGDVYQGLEADKWDESDMDFAARHLLILSGLYGLLRPADAILPYRLEMGTELKVKRKKDLYDFWKQPLAAFFQKNVDQNQTLVNLASNEYFKALQTAAPQNPVLKVDFKDKSNGKYRVVSFFAKKARGMMANFMVQNRITTVDELKDFNLGQYFFDGKSSTNEHFIFLRD